MAKQINNEKAPRKVTKRRHRSAPFNHQKKLGPKER